MAETLSKEVKLNRDTDLLKLVAILTMFIDHLGAAIFPQYRGLRIIGRIAFPIFAYCIAVGCIYTRNIAKYALRVFAMGVLVQPLYVTALNHIGKGGFDWLHNFYRIDLIAKHYYMNPYWVIHFTLLAGILIIWTLKKKNYLLTAVALAACWYLKGYIN